MRRNIETITGFPPLLGPVQCGIFKYSRFEYRNILISSTEIFDYLVQEYSMTK